MSKAKTTKPQTDEQKAKAAEAALTRFAVPNQAKNGSLVTAKTTAQHAIDSVLAVGDTVTVADVLARLTKRGITSISEARITSHMQHFSDPAKRKNPRFARGKNGAYIINAASHARTINPDGSPKQAVAKA